MSKLHVERDFSFYKVEKVHLLLHLIPYPLTKQLLYFR